MGDTPFVFTVTPDNRNSIKAVTMNALDWDLFSKNDRGAMSTSAAYNQIAWIRRCVDIRANAVSSVPFVLYKGKRIVKDWPLANILPDRLWRIEAALQIYGAGYLVREKNFVIDKDLRWLLPTTITPKYATIKGLTSFIRKINGKDIQFALDEIIYFWLQNLSAELGPGLGWISTVLDEAQLAQFMNTFSKDFFERGAIPATVLSVEGNPSEDALKSLERWWNKLLSGAKNAFKTHAISASIKPTILSFPIDQLAMPALTDSVRQQICVAAGVPQTMLEDAANYATAVEQRKSFYAETIVPELTLIEAAFNQQYFEPQGLRIVLDYEALDIFQEDEAARAASLQALWTAMSPALGNEALIIAMQMLGMELPNEMTYDQLRALMDAKEPEPAPVIVQPGQQPLQLQQALQEQDAQPKPEPYAMQEIATWRRFAEKYGVDKAMTFKVYHLSESEADIIRQRLALLENEPVAKDVFSYPFDVKINRRTRAGKADPNAQAKNDWESTLTNKTKRLLKDQLARIMDRIWQEKKDITLADPDYQFWQDELAIWGKVLPIDLLRMAQEASQALFALMPVGVDWLLVADAAAEWAHRYAFDLIKDINDTSLRLVSRAIQRFVQTPGATREELETMLRPYFGEVRASMIAVTETTRAYAQGEIETAKIAERAGLKMIPVWNTSEDELVCAVCGALDGKKGAELNGQVPPAHVRCRCWPTHEWDG